MCVSAPPIVPTGMAFATACSISHGATPSGNAVAPSQLQRLGHLPGVITLQAATDRADLPAMLARPTSAHPQAWVCRGPQCLAPITDIESLLKSLS